MLETKPQYAGSASAPRSSARLASSVSGAAAARPLTPRPPTERPTREADRAGRRPPDGQAARRRVARSESRLLTWAVASAVVVCGLLVLYLAAYARLTTLGIEQARAQRDFHEKWQQNQMLSAQLAALKNPDRIAAQAVRLGLTRDSKRVDYIAPALPTPTQPAPSVVAQGNGARREAFSEDVSSARNGDTATTMTGVGGEAGPQGTDSGPTIDDNTAAHHD